MSDRQPILLLADPAVADRLSAAAPPGAVRAVADAFAALEALADGDHAAVVVAMPQWDLPRLLSAMRKTKPSARLYGLCTPAQEHQLLQSCPRAERLIDDYFIMPPTSAEWRRILGVSGVEAAELRPAVAEPALSAREIASLVEAAVSPEDLAQRVAELVGRACRTEVRWSTPDNPRPGIQQLVVMGEAPARKLFATAPLEVDAAREQWLSALRAILPDLFTVARRMELFRRLAITDDLTGAHNRRYFMHMAARLLEEARRRRVRSTLLLYDIDDFKRYNDGFGHAAGDEILRETAELMQQIVRKGDLVARVGGDEFAALFCEFGPVRQAGSQPIQTPYQLVDRFRKAVNSHEFKSLGPSARGTLTISGGLACFPWDGATVEQLLAAADKAMLAAKASGKNNIYLVGGEEH
jgi:diguanylate cyclase (GGDEF)-like protein